MRKGDPLHKGEKETPLPECDLLGMGKSPDPCSDLLGRALLLWPRSRVLHPVVPFQQHPVKGVIGEPFDILLQELCKESGSSAPSVARLEALPGGFQKFAFEGLHRRVINRARAQGFQIVAFRDEAVVPRRQFWQL